MLQDLTAIKDEFPLDSNGFIASWPFAGEPLWVPYFWNQKPSRVQISTRFYVLCSEDWRNFPELSSFYAISLYESPSGAVHGSCIATPASYHAQVFGRFML